MTVHGTQVADSRIFRPAVEDLIGPLGECPVFRNQGIAFPPRARFAFSEFVEKCEIIAAAYIGNLVNRNRLPAFFTAPEVRKSIGKCPESEAQKQSDEEDSLFRDYMVV